jgi:hypothetical protein
MIYVLVPAYNELCTVGLLLWKVRQVFAGFGREYRLMVVDDASTDGTADLLAPYEHALPLTLFTHRQRAGYAGSLERLLRAALGASDRPRRDFAVTLQADFSDSPDELPELVRRLEGGADIAVADATGGRDGSRLSRWVRASARHLVRPGARIPGVCDYCSTLAGYRLATLAPVFREPSDTPVLRAQGWAAAVELLLAAAPFARRVESVATSSTPPPRQRPSRAHPLGEALRILAVTRRFPRDLAHGAARAAAHPPASPDPPRQPRRSRRRSRRRQRDRTEPALPGA